MKKKIKFKKIIIILLILSVWWYAVYANFFAKKTTKTSFSIVETPVKKWNIENSIKTTWTAELVDEQKMRFNQSGKVSKVNYKDWDKIKKWAVIAELDKTDIQNTIKQAQISVSDAQIKLEEILKWPEQKDLLKYEWEVTSAKNKIENLNIDITNLEKTKNDKIADLEKQIKTKNDDIKSKTEELTNSKTDLELYITQSEKDVWDLNVDNSKTIEDAFSNSKKYLIDIEKTLNSVDEIFWISTENKSKNDDYELYLSAKNTNLKNQTSTLWSEINLKLQETNSLYSSLESNKSEENATKILTKISEIYSSLIDLSKTASNSVYNSITSTDYSQSQIDSDYNNMIWIWTTAQSNFSQTKTSLSNIAKLSDPEFKKQQTQSTITQKQKNISDLEINISNLNKDILDLNKDITDAKTDYETNLKQKQFEIISANNSLAIAEENLKDLKNWATSESIATAKNNIAKQVLNLENAKKNLEKYELTAPFDWVVRKIDFKVWDNLVSDDTKYVYIENPNLVKITSTIDQLDIVNIKEKQSVRIIFDSYSTSTLTWMVSEINSTPIETSGVTSYTVTITLEKWKFDIYSWMTAKVYIIISGKQDVLVLDSVFLQKRWDKTSVLKKNWTKQIMTEVVTGVSNTTQTEIVSWLFEWDKVVRRVATSSTWSTKTTQSSIMMPGAWGWPEWWWNFRQSSWNSTRWTTRTN